MFSVLYLTYRMRQPDTRTEPVCYGVVCVYCCTCLWAETKTLSLSLSLSPSYCHHLWITCSSAPTACLFFSPSFLLFSFHSHSTTLTTALKFLWQTHIGCLGPDSPSALSLFIRSTTRTKKLHTIRHPTAFSQPHPSYDVSHRSVSFVLYDLALLTTHLPGVWLRTIL